MHSTKSGLRKLGAAIYLKSYMPLAGANFISDFRNRWPETKCENEGQGADCSRLGIGQSQIAIEVRGRRLPDSVTNAVMDNTLHWPTAKQDISTHEAHIAVAGSIDGGDTFLLASDLTKTVVSLLAVTNSLCVCWLNGPVLSLRDDFMEIATELLEIGQPPFTLWVGSQWEPKGGLVHTKGMAQFGAPEIFLAQQSRLSEENVAYLHHLIKYVLSGNTLAEGETVDGPNCIYTIKCLQGRDSEKTGLFLVPGRAN
jgi:hypothetical protein